MSAGIHVGFVANHSLECNNDFTETDTIPTFTSSGPSPSTPAGPSGTTSGSPSSMPVASSSTDPADPQQEAMFAQFSQLVIEQLQALEKPRKGRKPKSAQTECDTATIPAQTIALQAILLDNSTWLPSTNVVQPGWEKWSPRKLRRHMKDAIDEAGDKAALFLNVWKNVGEKQTKQKTSRGGATQPPAKLQKTAAKTDKGKGFATDQDSDELAVEDSDHDTRPSDVEEDDANTSTTTDQPGPKRKAAGSRDKENKRMQKDLSAQETVPKHYGHRCALTRKLIVDTAHIFPVGVRKRNLDKFWSALETFWPNDKTDAWQEALEQTEMERRNIIPLSPEAHKRWDRHYFALRPIRHKTNPNVLYVQLCYSTPIDLKSGERPDVNNRDFIDIQGQDKVGGLCDWRDVVDNNGEAPYSIRAIRSGDIFRFTTSDPKKYPLPDHNLLALQWALHRVLGSLKAAGALSVIFSHDPPDDAPAVASGGCVHLDESLLAHLVDIAEEKGTITAEKAAKWRGTILQSMYEKMQSRREFVADISLGQHLPPMPTFDEFLAQQEPAHDEDEEVLDTSSQSQPEEGVDRKGSGVKRSRL